ncbi:MAG: hypothetical protein SVY41_02460 [Candidatus Nanohaloarchaea archaeon]|nr:hypothetical protein [Candidatus Nanohaloarchaea archaeon]
MNCGIVLTGDTDQASAVAFYDDGEVTVSDAASNDDIVALVAEKGPTVVALNAPPKRSRATDFREGEEELIDDGHAMLPQGMRDQAVLERADHLARSIQAAGTGTTIIESNARLAGDILGLEGDADLEDHGIGTGDITSTRQYDAVVLAIVADLYADNRCEDHGIVVPEDDVTTI